MGVAATTPAMTALATIAAVDTVVTVVAEADTVNVQAVVAAGAAINSTPTRAKEVPVLKGTLLDQAVTEEAIQVRPSQSS